MKLKPSVLVNVMMDMPFGVRHVFSACRIYTSSTVSHGPPSPQGEGLCHALPNVGGLSQFCKIDKKRFFEQKWAQCPFCSTKIRKNFSDWMGCLKSHNNPPWPLKNRILHRCRFRHTSYCRNLPPWIITILKRSWYEVYFKVIKY